MSSKRESRRRRMRTEKDIARRAPIKSPYESALIVCEGEKSEVNYFNGLLKANRLNTANVEVLHSKKGSAPISIVEYAIEIAENNEGIDKVFCVFDRDDHKSYEQALEKLKNYKPTRRAKSKPTFHAIVSTPCFEFWALLHFIYTTKVYYKAGKHSACDNLITDLYQHLPAYAKNSKNLYEQLNENIHWAISNAKKLKVENDKTNSMNPSTDVYLLVEYLIRLKND